MRQGRHLDYHWNGDRVDFYRDAAAGKLVLDIEAAYPISEVAEAVRASGEPGRKGKIAIKGS